MADTILKTKVQLRSTSVTSNGSSNGGDKTPTTPSKLMINHGKPNFTIQRSPKIQQNDDGGDPFSNGKNNNYNAFKTVSPQSYNNNNIVVSTKFNGAFRATNVPIVEKQPHQSNGNGNGNDNDNEAAKVVLRRAKAPEPSSKENEEDDSVPEFIRRQRRIQERLAKENILDFENRRSGYFTHVMITPTSPNRQSFGATMSSPPIVPALETPAPAKVQEVEEPHHETVVTPAPTKIEEVEEPHHETVVTNGDGNENSSEHHTTAEEEEVAKAIEEVNKAVEGEDDEIRDEPNTEVVAIATTWEEVPDTTENSNEQSESERATVMHNDVEEKHNDEHNDNVQKNDDVMSKENGHTEAVDFNGESTEEAIAKAKSFVQALDTDENDVETQQNGHTETVEVHATQENGHEQNGHNISISHTNGFDGPSIPAPDPSGNLGVNYEPKTVVSFSKDLGSEPNKYPDTVKVVTQNGNDASAPVDEKLQELTKLKFDIKADEQDVQVTPVLRAD